MRENYEALADEVIKTENGIDRTQARANLEGSQDDLAGLAAAADRVRRHFRGNSFELESITNIKSGACPEDCTFCSQSAHFSTEAEKYPLISEEETLKRAKNAEKGGATKFCLVAAWRGPTDGEFTKVLGVINRLQQETKLDVHCSLGFLTQTQAHTLKTQGVKRYNHNLETAESFFPKVCTTHTWQERAETVRRVKRAGMEACSGGVIGMGETPEERLDLAFEAAELGIDEFPLNILNPRPGTPLSHAEVLEPLVIIRTIAVYRLIMPKVVLKVSGGREISLGSYQEYAFRAGADSFILGDYLTTQGGNPKDDVEMIKKLGFEIGARRPAGIH